MPGTVQCALHHSLHLFVMAVSLWGWITIPMLLLSKLRLRGRSGTLATLNLCNSYNTGILITDHREALWLHEFPKKSPRKTLNTGWMALTWSYRRSPGKEPATFRAPMGAIPWCKGFWAQPVANKRNQDGSINQVINTKWGRTGALQHIHHPSCT